jgi:predicted metal-dependent enzyme (double-stranded beta helix superfamily)
MNVTGADTLIAMAEHAVAQGDVEKIVDELRTGLCSVIRSGEVQLPAEFRKSGGDHYARRLVHRDDRRGYSVVAMTWGPGQATPLHDHGGMWCVEGVWEGSIDVQQYELVERESDRFRFEKRNSFQAGKGSAGCLIPPHEYHRICNRGDEVAISLHIYGGDMNRCSVFEPQEGGWYVRHEKALGLDL